MAVQTRLDECLSIREGRLFVEDCDAVELARRFGTPVHVISEDQLRRNATAVKSGARITLDSVAELDLVRAAAAASGRRASVRVRVRPDFSALTQATDWYEDGTSIAEAARLYKAGIPTEDALELGLR